MRRAVFSSVLTFTLGIAGGAVGARLYPLGSPSPLAVAPAQAHEVRVSGPDMGDGIADLVDAVKPAVVNIDTVIHRKVPVGQTDMFRYFFGNQGFAQPGFAPPMQEQVEEGIGSGFIVRQDGLIVTNYHVVRGADKMTVTTSDGKKYTGRVVGSDPSMDLALVKIDASGMTTLKLADPHHLRVGQYVVAVGSPLGLQQTVTAGILSAIDRDIALNSRVSFLQTDAPINPGNSGGPLLNMKGEVVGVNTAIAAHGQGIGFAIPVGTIQAELPQLEAKGHVDHPWLGLEIGDLPQDKSHMFYPVSHGVLVGQVEKDGPAAQAGLRSGDVIESLDGKPLQTATDLIHAVNDLSIGNHVSLLVSRQGQEKTFHLTLAKMPARLADAAQNVPEGGN